MKLTSEEVTRIFKECLIVSSNIKPEDYASIADPYKAKEEYGLVDPIGILAEITKREEEIDAFLSNCDSALQISNCTTYIEF